MLTVFHLLLKDCTNYCYCAQIQCQVLIKNLNLNLRKTVMIYVQNKKVAE